jgi:hypothetical protein
MKSGTVDPDRQAMRHDAGETRRAERSITSTRWLWLVAALAAALLLPALVQADAAGRSQTGAPALAPSPTQGDFAGRVPISGGSPD